MVHNAQSLFREVADLGGAERQDYYEKHEVPEELRAEVESLLGFDGTPDGSFTNCVAGVTEQALRAKGRLGEGARCGPFVLERLLGRGGMGVVFLARRADGEVEQQVAIKLVRNAADEPRFRDRFLRERQILASLSHPGIARLLDAGHTASGQPYLALEFVDGTPIDAYCRTLDVRRKLELFLKVCDALSYAHRNLVIHRDLKPSNILVEAGGQPKLLDFGIARILVPDQTDGAVTKERMLTPDFASPEQVLGAARTTATDVYSLGAVLYHLLTGRSPHAPTKGSTESEEVRICTREMERPSRVNPHLPRDLDYILAKALRKEPEMRYASVDLFADDVRACLESRPVRARSGSAWYHTAKFLRRRWLPMAAVLVALVSLSVGLYTANRQGAIAQRRFLQLRQLANKVVQFDPGIRGLPGSTKARQQIVSAGIEYLDGLGAEARGDPALALEVAGGYTRLAEVQGVPTVANLGQYSNAEESLRKAEKLVNGVLADAAENLDALSLKAEIEQYQMILADTQRHAAEARAYGQRCVADMEALQRSGRAPLDSIRQQASMYSHVGQSCMNRHEMDDAIRYARRGVELARSTGEGAPSLANELSLLANVLRQTGDLNGALAIITEARTVAERAAFPDELSRALTLYSILWRQGQILGSIEGISLGRSDAALEPLQKAFDLMEQQASKDPNDATSRDREGTAAEQLGDLLWREPGKALAVFDRALMRQREAKGNVRAKREAAWLLARSSYPLRQLHRGPEARQRIDSAFELLRASKDYPADSVELGGVAEVALRAAGDLAAESGQVEQAIATYNTLLDKVMTSRPNPRGDLRQANDLSRIYLALERLHLRQGQADEAHKLANLRLALWREWDGKLPGNFFVQQQLMAKVDGKQ